MRKAHRGASTLVSRVPHNLTIETNSSGLSRLYFLSVPPGQRDNTLVYVEYDINSVNNGQDDGDKPLEWHPLLDSFPTLTAANAGQMSKEEQLMRERKRLRSFGITGYDYQRIDGRSHFAFYSSNSMFVCSDSLDGGMVPVSSPILFVVSLSTILKS